MACARSTCVLRFLGWTCVVLALLPYYSKTTHTRAGDEKASLGAGSTGQGKPRSPVTATETRVQFGLPCSPLFSYEHVTESSQPPPATAPSARDVAAGKSESHAEGQLETYTMGFKSSMGVHFVSWSMGLLVLGEVLFFAARRCGPQREAAGKPAVDPGDDVIA